MNNINLIFPQCTNSYASSELSFNEKKQPYQSVSNLIITLLNPKYAKKDQLLQGQFFYDTFAQDIKLYGKLAGEIKIAPTTIRSLDDNIINKLGIEIEKKYEIKYNKNNLIEAIRYIANIYALNPAQEYIKTLKWSGNENAIRQLLPTYLGAEDSDVNAWIMEHMIVGMVQRIFEPGSKMDEMLVLLGSQGLGKSTFSRYLSLDETWFCTIENIKGKDAVMNMLGKSVVEIEEFVALRNAKSPNESKAFISKLHDRIRIPFDKFSRDIPRSCILIGTLNETTFLNDHTGERRYLPVKCSLENRIRSIYPLETYLDGKSNQEYEQMVKQDFIDAVALGYKIYQEKSHQVNLTNDLKEQLEYIREECKYVNPDVENIRYFLEVYKPTTLEPTITCWRELEHQGYGIKSKSFTEVMVNHFPNWQKISLHKTTKICPNGKSIPVKLYYKKIDDNEE